MIAEGNKVFYIHGLYGSRSSRKFGFIQQKYPTALCLEWKFNDNINVFIENTFHLLETIDDKITLIGSSVGGNLAWQIQQKLIEIGKHCELILINPLVEVAYKYEDNFPHHLEQYIQPMLNLSQTKVIIAMQDEIINAIHSRDYFEMYDFNHPNQIEVITIDGDHRVSNFNEYVETI